MRVRFLVGEARPKSQIETLWRLRSRCSCELSCWEDTYHIHITVIPDHTFHWLFKLVRMKSYVNDSHSSCRCGVRNGNDDGGLTFPYIWTPFFLEEEVCRLLMGFCGGLWRSFRPKNIQRRFPTDILNELQNFNTCVCLQPSAERQTMTEKPAETTCMRRASRILRKSSNVWMMMCARCAPCQWNTWI